MTPDEALQRIARGDIAPVYFLHGGERFYHVEILRALEAGLSAANADAEELSREVFDARTRTADEWLGAANTVSFFGGKKLIVARDVNETAFTDGQIEKLARYLAHPAPDTCLLMTAEKIDRKRKAHKLLAELPTAVICEPPPESVLAGWIKRRAGDLGYKLDAEAAAMMVERAGARPGYLAAELEKTIAYAGEGKTITAGMAAALTGYVKQESAFALSDALKNRDVAAAIRLLRNQMQHGEEPLKLLGAIAWQYRMIWETQSYLRQRLTPAQIAAKTGNKPFAVEKAARAAGAFTHRQLQAAFAAILRADQELKSSGGGAETVMETLVLRLCSAR